ncbi:hypothetical protein L6164_029075 [Bauhinia variegata]|uniref:Uncharacterized protein n=1 Tax=Bauhinia variegata TaxID=167791 RepID=A0ACB9L8L8_BAUVA|nr:hypothetical protein L6164_029075 [Bauhinia variegata]
MMKGKSKTNILTEEKKRKKKREKDAGAEKAVRMNVEEVNGISVGKKKKEKTSTKRKRKNRDKNLVGTPERSDGMVDVCPSESQEITDFEEHRETDCRATIKPCRSKKAKKKRKKEENFVEEVRKSPERGGEADHGEVYIVSSGDEDSSKGMKKWITEYHQSRPGLNVLQQQIDDFITAHDEKLEQERKERESLAAEGGWTVVVHHKGRKKTTDSESGIAVGSVAQAAVEGKMAKKKRKEVGLDLYRFQKKEAQRNEIMMLQSKFEEDKKRLQQLRAARKFRPY